MTDVRHWKYTKIRTAFKLTTWQTVIFHSCQKLHISVTYGVPHSQHNIFQG